MEINYRQRVVQQSSVVYGLGFIGATIYFIQHAVGFWMGVLGFLKATVWPVFLVYHLFDFLKLLIGKGTCF